MIGKQTNTTQNKKRSKKKKKKEEEEGSMPTRRLSNLIVKRTNASSILNRVVIVGGTHGNELAGVHLVNYFNRNPCAVERPSFETKCILSNLDAIDVNRRYITTDLNRCFDASYLNNAEKTPKSERTSEMQR